jgi:hypothetical protein
MKLVFFIMLCCLAYLLLGTGLHGDDYIEILKMSNFSNAEYFYPSAYLHGHYILGLPAHYLLFWGYKFLGYEYLFIYDAIKVLAHTVSIFLVYEFLKNFFPTDRALVGSFLFILFPLHDATTYWYMALVYILPAALISYSCHLLINNSWSKSFIFGILGATFFYTSPPFTFGLSLIFLLQKQFKKFFFFLTPGLLYVCYYLGIKIYFPFAEKRINDSIDSIGFIKSLLGQIASSLESFLGPSFFLKIYYSILSIEIISLGIVSLMLAILIKSKRRLSKIQQSPKILIISLCGVLFLSFVIFASTGQYNHSPFNLGNRTLIYASFLASVLIVSFAPSNRKSLAILCIFFLLPIFGLSDYWKKWNIDQQVIITSVNQSIELSSLKPQSIVFITDNLYKKLGPFDHVEFFSMPWNIKAIFNQHVANQIKFISLSSYLVITENKVIDMKFEIEYLLNKNIYLYQTDTDTLLRVTASELNSLILNRSPSFRHWIQGFKDTRIEELIITLNPRLEYIFK